MKHTVVVTLGLLLAACGGSGSSSSAPTPNPSPCATGDVCVPTGEMPSPDPVNPVDPGFGIDPIEVIIDPVDPGFGVDPIEVIVDPLPGDCDESYLAVIKTPVDGEFYAERYGVCGGRVGFDHQVVEGVLGREMVSNYRLLASETGLEITAQRLDHSLSPIQGYQAQVSPLDNDGKGKETDTGYQIDLAQRTVQGRELAQYSLTGEVRFVEGKGLRMELVSRFPHDGSQYQCTLSKFQQDGQKQSQVRCDVDGQKIPPGQMGEVAFVLSPTKDMAGTVGVALKHALSRED